MSTKMFHRRALSLLEIVMVITLLGILSAIVVPRLVGRGDSAKQQSCELIRGNLEVQAQLWYRNKGVWPAADLSDMAADAAYLPEGLPTCPSGGSAYTFDSATERIIHGH